jgi:hypothetical protein
MQRLQFSAVFAVVAFSALIGGATTAAADNFGAIAYSPQIGTFGYAYDHDSRGEAEEHALQECGRACEIVLWFKNACGALAKGGDKGYGVGWASSRREAEGIAMSHCRENSSGCSVAAWTCTTR